MGAWNWLWSRAAAWIWFRTVAFWTARTAGWLRRRVSGLFGFWSGFTLTVFAAAIAGAYLPCSPSSCRFDLEKFTRSTSLPFLFEILVLYSIVWWGLVRSFRRKRLVVLTTVNHASKDFDLFAGGLLRSTRRRPHRTQGPLHRARSSESESGRIDRSSNHQIRCRGRNVVRGNCRRKVIGEIARF